MKANLMGKHYKTKFHGIFMLFFSFLFSVEGGIRGAIRRSGGGGPFHGIFMLSSFSFSLYYDRVSLRTIEEGRKQERMAAVVRSALQSRWGIDAGEDLSLEVIDGKERNLLGVLVPADTSKPIVEVTVHQKEGKALECFLEFCKAHFAGNKLKSDQVDTYRAQVKEHAKGQEIPDDMFHHMANMTSVDMVVLHPNRLDTDWVSVNLYVDDKGVAKQLPPNARATGICQACGVPTQVLGDAVIGMQFDNNDGFQRFDFGLKQLNDDKWISRANQVNMQSRSAANTQDMTQRLQSFVNQSKAEKKEKPKPLSEEEQQKRLELKRKQLSVRNATKQKESGNAHYVKGRFAQAIAEYTKGLGLLHLENGVRDENSLTDNQVAHLLLSNRSVCFMKESDFDHALRDAELTTELKPEWAKGYGRKADALIGLERWGEARDALEKALSLNPTGSTAELEERLEVVNSHLS